MFKLPKITKEQFKKLFKIFSLILMIGYPIMPFLSSFYTGDTICEDYDTLTCVSVMLIFIVLIFFFWCATWLMCYIAFFMEDYRGKVAENKLSSIFYWYARYVQSSFREKLVQEVVIKLILTLLCAGVSFLFIRELLSLFT